jgi:hypothetical protein
MSSDGAEDVTIAINSSPNKLIGSHVNSSQLFTVIGGGILCAKASMLLQVWTLIHPVLATVIHLCLLYNLIITKIVRLCLNVECATCPTSTISEGASLRMG